MKDKVFIMNRLQEIYNFLQEEGLEVVAVFLYGSQNYDLQHKDSDIDCKAIILPKLDDIVDGNKPLTYVYTFNNNEQVDIKDIRLMFGSYLKQNVNFIETLFTEYKIVNPKYEEKFKTIFELNELIARYNTHSAVNCISGMAMEKLKALTHPYPSTKDKIDKYGYDSKQLHHIFRLRKLIENYVNNVEYSKILKDNDKDYLLKIKLYQTHTLEEAKYDAKRLCQEIYDISSDFKKNNELKINYAIEDSFKYIIRELLKIRFKEELI